jgi:thiol-disulfide isomerase/thioredoxin
MYDGVRNLPLVINTRYALRAARCALLLALALGLAACGPSATPTPVQVPAPVATVRQVEAGTPGPLPTGSQPLPQGVGTVAPGAVLPEGPITPGTGGGDQPLPTTSPGVVAKPPTPLPGTLTLPTPVPTAPGQTLPNPEGTAGPSGADDLPPGDAQIGQPAPDFTVTRLDTGEAMRLSDFKGRPVWINFWATWCAPCKEEMPRMQAVYQAHQDSDLVILGVDFREDAALVRPFVAEGQYSWTFALDPDARAAWTYFVAGIPTHVFVARDGTIRDIVSAGLTRERMEQQVAALLK